MTRLSHLVSGAAMTLAALAIAGMAGVTLVDVVGRAVFGVSIRGVYELVQIGLCVAVFAGMVEVSRRGGHVVIDLIDATLPPRALRVLRAAAAVLTAATMVALIRAGWSQAHAAMAYGDVTGDLGLPLAVFWAPILLGLVLSVAATLLTLAERR